MLYIKAEDYEVFQVSIKNHQIRRKQMIKSIDYNRIFSFSLLLCISTFLFFSTTLSFKVFILTLFGQLIVTWLLSFYQCHHQERLLDKSIYVDMAFTLMPLIPISAITLKVIYYSLTYVWTNLTTFIIVSTIFSILETPREEIIKWVKWFRLLGGEDPRVIYPEIHRQRSGEL